MKRELLSEIDEEILLIDGFDEAIVGYIERFGQPTISLYDKNKCINILMERDGMDYQESTEFFEFNILGSYVGEYTPAFVTYLDDI